MKIRRLFVLFLIFAMLFSMAAFADVAYTPRDDFYEKHYDECQGLERHHLTNGSEGYVVGFASPTGEAKVVIPNGKEYFVSVLWSEKGGKVWGCIEYDPETLDIGWSFQGAETAWVDMSAMTPRYDSEAFMEDHADELKSEERILKIGADDKVPAYRYPGSGIITDTLENWNSSEDQSLILGNIYTDAEGREWGRVGYYYGIRDVWVCIDEPHTELAAGAEFTEREIIPAADEAAMKKALNESSGLSANILVGAVGAVVIAGAIIAYIIIRKRRAE